MKVQPGNSTPPACLSVRDAATASVATRSSQAVCRTVQAQHMLLATKKPTPGLPVSRKKHAASNVVTCIHSRRVTTRPATVTLGLGQLQVQLGASFQFRASALCK